MRFLYIYSGDLSINSNKISTWFEGFELSLLYKNMVLSTLCPLSRCAFTIQYLNAFPNSTSARARHSPNTTCKCEIIVRDYI